MAVNRHVRMLRRRGAVRGVVRFRTIGDATCTAAVESRRSRWTTSSPRRPSPGSPSAAPPAPTTASPRRAWRTASARVTSEMALEDDLSRRLGRRPRCCGSPRSAASTTASHADRAPAARLEVDLRGPARAHRGGQPEARHRLRRPRPADRRPARRARAGHHDRRRLPLLLDAAPRLRDRRLPGPRAVHAQRDHRRLDGGPGASCWSTPATAWSSRPAATAADVPARRAAPRDLRQQDGSRRATTRTASTRS